MVVEQSREQAVELVRALVRLLGEGKSESEVMSLVGGRWRPGVTDLLLAEVTKQRDELEAELQMLRAHVEEANAKIAEAQQMADEMVVGAVKQRDARLALLEVLGLEGEEVSWEAVLAEVRKLKADADLKF